MKQTEFDQVRGAGQPAPLPVRGEREEGACVMAATWTTCWAVSYGVGYTLDGEPLVEYTASRARSSVTVRQKGATHGGKRFKPEFFDENFGATADEAIEKYLAKQQFALSQARHDVEALKLMIRKAKALRNDLNISFRPTGEQLEAMRKMVES